MMTVIDEQARRRGAREMRRSLSRRFLGVNPVLKGRLKRNLESAQGRDLRLASVRATGQPVRVCQGVRQRQREAWVPPIGQVVPCRLFRRATKIRGADAKPFRATTSARLELEGLEGKRSNGEPRGELRGDQGHKTWLIDRVPINRNLNSRMAAIKGVLGS